MPSPESPFEPFRRAWPVLRARLENLFGRHECFYALPPSLLEAIQKESPDWFTTEELSAEIDLHRFCVANGAVGIAMGKAIAYSLLMEPIPQQANQKQFTEMNWQLFTTLERMNESIPLAEKRLDPFERQEQSFVGWLITNSTYLDELERIKDIERSSFGRDASKEQEAVAVEAFDAFCHRWRLRGMETWDLPRPQSPQLSGLQAPASVRPPPNASVFTMPDISRLPTAFPFSDVIKEARGRDFPTHLDEWRRILEEETTDGAGLGTYEDIMPLHFYVNIVLRSRYAGRFAGRIGKLDEAYSQYANKQHVKNKLGAERIKRLRLLIQKRLETSP